MVIDQSPHYLTRGQQEILIKIFEKDVFIDPSFSKKVHAELNVGYKEKNLSLGLVYVLKHFTFDRDLLNYLLEMEDFIRISQAQSNNFRLR